MLLPSTISNVQAPFVQLEALINRINDDKSMVMHTEGDVGAWDTYLEIGWIGHDEYMIR